MHSFTTRLQSAFADSGITQAELARRCGVTRATVHEWLSGRIRKLEHDNLIAVAGALDVAPRWLTHGDVPQHLPAAMSGRGAYRALRKVPLVRWDSAGTLPEADQSFPAAAVKDWIEVPLAVGPQAFALRVIGDSMEPALAQGAIVVFDPSGEPAHGKIVLTRTAGEKTASIKRLWFDGATPYLKPDNARYAIAPLTADARIVAVAVLVFQEL